MNVARGLQPESWHLLTLLDRAPGPHALADTLSELVDEGHPIVAGTADLKYSNGLVRFQERHPDRYVQFGISEQHMVFTAAGLATTGWQPYVATFASFLALLACEQIRTPGTGTSHNGAYEEGASPLHAGLAGRLDVGDPVGR